VEISGGYIFFSESKSGLFNKLFNRCVAAIALTHLINGLQSQPVF
jgi:hypothetical protein